MGHRFPEPVFTELLTERVFLDSDADASGIVLDNTTLLVLNNAARLGYGSVGIVNLFDIPNDSDLTAAEAEDPVKEKHKPDRPKSKIITAANT